MPFNLRLAFRTLFRTPFVTTIAVISLALGIGANAAIFSLFNTMLLRSLPVPEPDRLVNLSSPGVKSGSTSCGNAGDCTTVFSYPMFRDLERQQSVFTGLAAHRQFGANLAYRGQTVTGDGLTVSGSYFPVLGIVPARGRLLDPNDDRAVGQSNVVVISHGFWRDTLEGSPAVLNDTLIVNGQPMTIVGVTPPGFHGTTIGSRPDVYVPITMQGFMQPGTVRKDYNVFENRRAYWIYLFARLKPGVTIEQARAALQPQYHAIVNDVEAPLQKGMSDETLARFREKVIGVDEGPQGQSTVIQESFAPLALLLGVTGVVLLSACANIANLLLARATRRSGEMAVRLAIGAGRRHLVTQLLGESVLLAAMGGVAGLFVARWTLSLIAASMPAEAAQLMTFELDGRVVLFLAVVTVATGLLFGLFPAIHSTRPDLTLALKTASNQSSGTRSAKFFRAALATTQITLSMALLAIAGLFTKSLINVHRVDLGIETEQIVTFGVAPELNGYTPDRSQQIFAQIEEELARQPGVLSVSSAMVPLLSGSSWGTNVSVQGFAAGPDTDTNSRYNEIGPGYFRTLGVALLAGREFTVADTRGAPKVAIVNEAFARKFNLGRDVVGKRMETGNSGKLDIEIVGFVPDTKYSDVKDEIPPLFFTPYRQDERLGFLTFYVRTGLPPDGMLPTMQSTVSRIDPTLPVDNLRTLPQQVRENVFLDRFVTTLSAAFAGLATLLAAVGLYGVLAYTIAQRTREIGLRMALGADATRVRGMVLGQVGIMTIVGGLLGLTLAAGAGRAAESLLFQLSGYDPVVLGGAAAVLVLVAFCAGIIPAQRAARIDPMRAMRYE
jgi:predicted permease